MEYGTFLLLLLILLLLFLLFLLLLLFLLFSNQRLGHQGVLRDAEFRGLYF